MEIIDALVVTLGLDKSAFDKGQADARENIAKTRESAEQAAKGAAANAKTQDDAERKLSGEQRKREAEADKSRKSSAEEARKREADAAKRQKEFEEGAKRLGQTLGRVSGAAAGLLSVFTAGRGIQGFTSQVIAANAETGRLAANLGVAPDSLSAWEKAVQAAGGSAEDARGAMAGLADTFEQLRHFQVPANAGILQSLGISQGDLEHADTALLKIRERLLEFQKSHNRQDTAWMAGQLGLNPAMTNLLLDPGFEKKMAAAREDGASKPETDAARDWERSKKEAENALSKSIGKLFSMVEPAVSQFVDGITHWVEDLNKPGNELKLGAAAAAVGAFTLGLGAITKKLVGWAASSALSSALQNGVPAPAQASPAPGKSGGILPLIGRLAIPLLGGYAAHEMDGDDGIGKWVDKHVPGAAGVDDWAYRHSGGWVGRSAQPTEGSAPAEQGKPGGEDRSSSPIHPSSFSPDEDSGSRIDRFWDRFGNGLIDWLERTPNTHGEQPGVIPANFVVPQGGISWGHSSSSAAPAVFGGSGDVSRALQERGLTGSGNGKQPPMSEQELRAYGALLGVPGTGAATPPGAHADKGAFLFGLEGQYGLPPALLDNIWAAESGRGRNRGPSRTGAMGDFQFMPGTAKQFGVNVMDFQSSAGGAARYFAQLLRMFRGDHRKAIAGYNWGQGNVLSAESRYGSAWDQHLPRETSSYLAQVTRGMSAANRYAGNGAAGGGAVTIGDVHVHTAATDSKGISKDIGNDLRQRMRFVSQANTGMS